MQDLGFDILMNPKKKQNSDSISINSNHSLFGKKYSNGRDEDNMSVKSININPNFIDVKQHMLNENDKSELSYDGTSEGSEYSKKKSQKKKKSSHLNSSVSSDDSRSEYSVDDKRMNDEDILLAKKELLYQFDRLEKKGIRLPQRYTLASNLEDMKADYDRLKRDKEIDASVKFQRRIMMAFASGVEFLNERFDPFDIKLSGWSEKINDDIDDYDEVFEDLHEKYKGKAKMSPELKLLFMMGSSAFMFHLTNSMFKNSLPGLDQVLKKNPELMKQFAAATASTMAQEQKQSNGPFGGLANMFSSMFSGGEGEKKQRATSSIASSNSSEFNETIENKKNRSTKMQGPSNVDEILKEMNINNNVNNRIEMMSTVSESEIFDLDDNNSINGLLLNTKKTKKGKNMVSLDL
jgi:hypothetical protein